MDRTVHGGWERRIRMKEICRYMGMREQDTTESFLAEIERQLSRLLEVSRVRSYWEIFPILRQGAGDGVRFYLGPMAVYSRDLDRNLQGCDQAAVFGATLGLEADRLIYRLEKTALGEAAITDACAAAAIEAVCDELCHGLKKEAMVRSMATRPRFSPGFGDFTLEYQPLIFGMLQLSKRIGISLTSGGMMTPCKSVTAVIGFQREAAEDGLPSEEAARR